MVEGGGEKGRQILGV